jgi:hypothetical protein
MALVNRQIPALFNGVSQQPDETRLPSQAEEQINFLGTVVDGLRRRPPSIHVAKLSSTNLSNAYLHIINRDVTERYTVVLTNGDIKVYDLQGNQKTVSFPGRGAFQPNHTYSTAGETIKAGNFLYKVTTTGIAGPTTPSFPTTLGATVTSGQVVFTCIPDYLKVSNARAEFACVTVADYTFVLNKTVVVGLEAAERDKAPDPEHYYWLNRVSLNPGGPIGQAVYDAFAGLQQQYTANQGTSTFKGTKQSLEDLADLSPAPITGDIWQIQGTNESAFQTYYVIRDGGVWDETVKPQLQNKFDPCTMPHALVRKGDGTFEFAPFSWNPRRVGDDNTNRHPSFVGRKIRDVFFYKNRLGVAVGEGVVLSRVGDFGTFHRLTTLDLLADEVIDAAASETKVTLINHAVPFDTGMMMFADQVQFKLNHGEVLSPGTVSPDVATSYEMVTSVRPLPLGSDVYFASEDGDWVKIYEYYVRDNATGTDAGEITGHVPKFIPAGITKIAGSAKQDLVSVLTDGAENRQYIYKFKWTDETTKAQSAWGYWEFGAADTILTCEAFDNVLFQVVARSDGTYLESLPLESGAKADGLDFQIFLDRRTVVNGTWLSVEGKTQFVLPYDLPVADRPNFRIVRGAGFTSAKGALISIDSAAYQWVDAHTVKVVGNFAGNCFCGLRFESRYTFSKRYLTNADGVAITSGDLTLIGYTLSFKDAAYFRTEVAPYGISPDIEEIIPSRMSEFDGKTLGAAFLALGAPVFSKGKYYFQVHGEADVATVSLVNDSPYASTFTQAEWEADYTFISKTV